MNYPWLPALERALDGRVIRRDDPDMVLANKQHAARLPFVPPALLVRCRSAEDVVRAVTSLRAAGQQYAVRSGGHCFADRSVAAPVVLDLAEMDEVRLEGELAILGPGVTAGAAVSALATAGRAIPTGGCIGVAIGGLALAGGFGFSGRRLGLLADRVRAMDVVLADGRAVRVTPESEPDLFWALRGGGCVGLAIVTALTIETAPLVAGVSAFGEWPIAEAAEVIRRWQDWAPDAADAVNIELTLFGPDRPEEPSIVRLHGGMAGEAAVIDGLERALGRYAAQVALTPLAPGPFAEHLVGLRDHRGELAWQPSYPFRQVGFQATRSHFFNQPFTADAIGDLIANLDRDRAWAQAREIELVPWGGAYARPAAPACFAHRAARLLVRHSGMAGAGSTPEARRAVATWAERSFATLDALGNGSAYQGYAEPASGDWLQRAYGSDRERLTEVKARFNPAL